MNRQVLAALALAAGFAQAAHGQQVDLTWSWLEVSAGTNTPVASPNGVLNPGEAARVSLRVQVTGIGTAASFGGHNGTIAALGTVGFDLLAGTVVGGIPNTSGIAGSQQSVQQAAAWATGPVGTFAGATSWVTGAGVGQALPTIVFENTAASVSRIWEEVWVPQTYTTQTAYFTSADNPGSSVILRYGPLVTDAVYMPASTVHHLIPPGIEIPIAPAPSGLAVMLASGLLFKRRR